MLNVKQKIAWLWQNAEEILIVAFFLTFSLNIRKVFLTPFSFLNGGFNEYMTMSFGWADLLMIGTIIIYNIKLLISQFRQGKTINALLENVIRNKSSVIRIYYSKNVSRETLYLLVFLGWIGLSIFWSQYRPIAIYRFLTLIEIALFAAVAIKNLRNNRWLRIVVFALVLNGLFQSLLSIAQFIHNGSLGIRFLGESIIGPNINGVAKIVIDGEKHIRAYGTFPHPNILAGFLVIPLLLIFTEFVQRKFLPTSSQLSSYSPQGEAGDNSPLLYRERAWVRCENVPHETFLWFIPRSALFVILLITGSGFLLTFSRSAFLGLFIALTIYFIWFWHLSKNCSFLSLFFKGRQRGILKNQPTINPSPTLPFGKRERRRYSMLLCSLVLLFLFLFITLNNTSFFSNQSMEERQLYQIVSYETISEHPVTGVGIGQFVFNEYNINPKLESWQYQPVHNIYLLIFSELGAIGFTIFFLFLISIFSRIHKDEQSGENSILTNIMFYCIILSFFVVSLFDHYFWDIKLGMIIFAVPLTFLFICNNEKEN